MNKMIVGFLSLVFLSLPSFASDEEMIEVLSKNVTAISYQANHLRALYGASTQRAIKTRTSELCVSMEYTRKTVRTLRDFVSEHEELLQNANIILDMVNGAASICEENHKRKDVYRAFSGEQAVEMDLLVNGKGGIKETAKKLFDIL